MKRGVNNPEHVADHMYMMAMMTFFIEDKHNLDKERYGMYMFLTVQVAVTPCIFTCVYNLVYQSNVVDLLTYINTICSKRFEVFKSCMIKQTQTHKEVGAV